LTNDSQADRQLKYLRLEELAFDPENPRLPTHRHGTTREVAIEWLLDSANLLELMRSIGQQGYFPGEPILVTPSGNGTFKVLEGNRRFGACLLLASPGLATTKKRAVATAAAEAEFIPRTIPALIFDNEDEVLNMLGYRHITGIQEWGPLAKARYLQRLWDSDAGPDEYFDRLKYIAKSIGSRSDYVARLLTSLGLYNAIEESQFFGIEDLDETTLSFSLLVLCMNRPAVAHFIGLEDGQDFSLDGLDLSELEHLTRWLYEKIEGKATVLQESRNMTKLVEVLEHPDALSALRVRGTTLDMAHRILGRDEFSLNATLAEVLADLVGARRLVEAGAAEVTQVELSSVDEVRVECESLRRRMIERAL
jgi:hypothetical protein